VREQVTAAVVKSKAMATLPSLRFTRVGDMPSSVRLMSFIDFFLSVFVLQFLWILVCLGAGKV
jgi:hypothetical protein